MMCAEALTNSQLPVRSIAKKTEAQGETIPFIEKGNYNPFLKLTDDIAEAAQTAIDDLLVFEDVYRLHHFVSENSRLLVDRLEVVFN